MHAVVIIFAVCDLGEVPCSRRTYTNFYRTPTAASPSGAGSSLNRCDELLTFKETVTTLAGASRSCANWKRHCARCARNERQSHAGLSGENILKHGNARLSALSIVDSKEPPRL